MFENGLAAATASGIQVTTLMWLHTCMNYQYRHEMSSLRTTCSKLFHEGGWRRFYRGYGAAMLHAPLARFGDIASNTWVTTTCPNWPLSLQTGAAAGLSTMFRSGLMPLDCYKTLSQVEGRQAATILRSKIKTHGLGVLWHGSAGALAASLVGYYPWFYTFNTLHDALPVSPSPLTRILRSALIGFSAACVSDLCSNSFRIIKTVRQTSTHQIPYREAVKLVISQDGRRDILLRGLHTRLLTHGIQSMVFTVLWQSLNSK